MHPDLIVGLSAGIPSLRTARQRHPHLGHSRNHAGMPAHGQSHQVSRNSLERRKTEKRAPKLQKQERLEAMLVVFLHTVCPALPVA